MKEIFHIKNTRPDAAVLALHWSLGRSHCSFAITTGDGADLIELVYCDTRSTAIPQYDLLLQQYPVLLASFSSVNVSTDSIESVLVPASMEASVAEEIGALSGIDYGPKVVSPVVTYPGLQMIQQVEPSLDLFLKTNWPAYKIVSALPAVPANDDAAFADWIVADFSQNSFRCIVFKSGSLVFMQTFAYSTPEDVVYFLMNIFQRLHLSNVAAYLAISGLVDERSLLHVSLRQYFLNVQFREAKWSGQREYPIHYFTALNDLALCE